MKKIIFLLFFMLFLVGVISLMNGISVSSFDSRYFSFSQLYVKLDKKLILRVKNIQINSDQSTKSKHTASLTKQNNQKSSIKQLLNLLNNANILNALFKYSL